MKPIAIVTDSTSDIPPDVADRLNVSIVPCHVHFGQEIFRDRVDLSTDEFYRKMASAPELPKTSQPSVGAFLDVYNAMAGRSSGIVSIHIGSRFSGTLQSAMLAAQDVKDIPVVPIDSGTTSMALGWLAIVAARAAQRTDDFDALVALIRAAVPRVHLLALLESLDNLVKGGRIGKGAALLGTMLSVKPILSVRAGEVVPLEKPRTWQRAQDRLVEMTRALGPLDDLAVLHTHAPENAEKVAERLGAFFPRDRIVTTEAGVVLGTHAGPGAVGVAALQRAGS